MPQFSKTDVIKNLRSKVAELEKLKAAVKTFVLVRRADIENDIENFGMLKPVLESFLEENT